ncbi:MULTISPECIES: VRR-NUC domain-containing protein [unclassified Halomonas]|uniref:VRR-NUC domain-containing protein n=1 Tax=unclassified Halomonas TaxID=2609666 RepID=UPI002883C3FA|nr:MULTISPECIES: VRR-NUC domain-containing protein [unclassified Halomonas]MDT0499692.1 VRR-NUC domain-containing protein [Halomonas sp. PAR7]MDT0510491.1 VRR-NUC domain-containing protein [Halomonas sp. LES1]MDT0589800.1 VRR-NUC domain-containing protein [Halomonas sp. PAR8]
MTIYRKKRMPSVAEIKRNPPTGARQAARRRASGHDYEGSEQEALISWLHGEWRRGTEVGQAYPVIYHVPNGGQRNKKTAADLKRQGVRAGVSDLVVMEGRGGLLGLYLEFKATPPRHAALARSQREWLALADARGYGAVLARGLEEAREVLREYMALPATEVVGPVRRLEAGTDWRS